MVAWRGGEMGGHGCIAIAINLPIVLEKNLEIVNFASEAFSYFCRVKSMRKVKFFNLSIITCRVISTYSKRFS